MVESALLFPTLILICMMLIGMIFYFYTEGIDKVELDMKAIKEAGSQPKLWKMLDEAEQIRRADVLEKVIK